MNVGKRLGILLVALAVVVIGFFVLRQDGEDSSLTSDNSETTNKQAGPKTVVAEIKVVSSDPGSSRIKLHKGDRLRLTVISSRAGEVHIHGYNYEKEVAAGGKVRFDFKATIEGIFHIELHAEPEEQEIGELEVRP